MDGAWLIYGVTGYTGNLVVEAARARGLAPIVAGRSREGVAACATCHGLEPRIFDLADVAAAREALTGVRVVANCAGPFSATARQLIDACLATGAHYCDVTGEIAVFEAAQTRHAEAVAAGVVICPGVGFDVIPTDCVATTLAATLPSATRLALAFDAGHGMSAGTARTILEGLPRGCLVREDGRIVTVRLGSRTRTIDLGTGPATTMAIPWGDVATAFYSTGIPTIEVFVPVPPLVPRVLGWLDPWRSVLARPHVQRWLDRQLGRWVRGPDAAARSRRRACVWGEVRDAAGRVATARVETANVYDVTVEGVLLAAQHLRAYDGRGGFFTPAQLLGPRCVERLSGSGPIVVSTS